MEVIKIQKYRAIPHLHVEKLLLQMLRYIAIDELDSRFQFTSSRMLYSAGLWNWLMSILLDTCCCGVVMILYYFVC